MTFSNMAGLKKRISSENRPKLKKQNKKKTPHFLLKKFQILEFHPVFCLWRREIVFLTCPDSFNTIPCRYFSKWRLKIFEVATTPYLRALTAHPTPILGGNPVFFFFHQNDTEVLHCPSVSPSDATAGCGWEGKGVRTPLVGLRTICAWDWGSYLLGAWTSGPECVTC